MVEEGDESLLGGSRIKSKEQNGWMEIVCLELNLEKHKKFEPRLLHTSPSYSQRPPVSLYIWKRE